MLKIDKCLRNAYDKSMREESNDDIGSTLVNQQM